MIRRWLALLRTEARYETAFRCTCSWYTDVAEYDVWLDNPACLYHHAPLLVVMRDD